MSPEWYEDRAELVAFARAMAEGDDEWTAARVLYLFEKPWKWSDEHAAWVAAGRPNTFDQEAA